MRLRDGKIVGELIVHNYSFEELKRFVKENLQSKPVYWNNYFNCPVDEDEQIYWEHHFEFYDEDSVFMDKEETKCTCEACVRFRNKPLINKNKIIIPFYDDEF